MINDTTLVWAVISTVVAGSFFLQRFKFFKILGPSVLCIAAGMLLANTGAMPRMHPVYVTILSYTIPLSLAMFMLSMDLKNILSLSKEPLLAVLFALFSVCTVAFLASFMFHDSIPNLYRYTGMFIGTYTGGSANLAAVGVALGATPSEFAAANGADYIVGMPVLILFFIIPSIIARSALAQKIFPYSLEEHELDNGSEHEEIFAPKTWSITDLSMLFAFAFGVTWFATYLSHFVGKDMQGAVKIITITTLSIFLGQFKQVKQIKGNVDVAIYISSFFLVVIGFLVNIPQFMTEVPTIAIYCGITIFASAFIYIILCRLFKIRYQYALIAFVAMIADGSTAAIISATNNWKSLISLAILLGMLGGVAGNYAGVTLGLIVKHLTGM